MVYHQQRLHYPPEIFSTKECTQQLQVQRRCISQVGCLLNYELSTGLRVEWHHICKYSLFPWHWFLVKNLIRALQFSEFSAGIRVFNGVCRQLVYCIVLFAGTGFFKNMIRAEIQCTQPIILLYIGVTLCQTK